LLKIIFVYYFDSKPEFTKRTECYPLGQALPKKIKRISHLSNAFPAPWNVAVPLHALNWAFNHIW